MKEDDDIRRPADYQNQWEIALATLLEGIDLLEQFMEEHGKELLPEDAAPWSLEIVEAIARLDRLGL